jgi:hypothetical protein
VQTEAVVGSQSPKLQSQHDFHSISSRLLVEERVAHPFSHAKEKIANDSE